MTTSPFKIAALVMVMASMALPAIAQADGREHDRREQRHEHDGRHDRRDAYRDGYRDGNRDDWRDDRRDNRRIVYRPAPVYRGSYRPAPRVVYGAPQRNYGWSRGARYYDRGYGPTYVVSNYRPYGLRQAPRGYGWRRSDAGDFLLVALATGVIADIVLHH